MAEPVYPDSYDGEEYWADEDDEVKCPRCHGSGHTMEGFDCEYCDGEGWIEL